jgi:2-oxo-4-hydroxy-4-carboxy--5-ureidoimidazoline (OHCU) decarboxylase
VLEHWPVSGEGASDRFTTVASWRGAYGPIRHGDTTFGLKVHEFRKFVELPERANQTFEIALDIHPADAADARLLDAGGWTVVAPATVAATPWDYRRYIQASDAELMVAKGMYVHTRGGWFSDRSICYLASGKPVIAQDTGFTEVLPTGAGLLAFTTPDEAVAAIDDVAAAPNRHGRRARELAAALPEAEKIATLNAHPRIGERPEAVSAFSYREQGYDGEAALATEQLRQVYAELAQLNEAYEQRFGFRFVVFVNKRPKSAIVEVLRDRLRKPRDAELQTALHDMFLIARDRYATAT